MTDKKPTAYAIAVLFGLGAHSKHVYEGSVSEGDKERRRAKNRVARKSRRINRRSR